jgi:hypothetical protein
MPQETTEGPAQVPGDAESPPRSEADRTARKAVNHSDPTEPEQASQSPGKQSGGKQSGGKQSG